MTTKNAAPKPAQVDDLVRRYAAAQSDVQALNAAKSEAQDKANAIKAELVELVEQHGVRHAEKSLRLEGEHTRATVTIGTRTVTDAAAVEELREYLAGEGKSKLVNRFFRTHVSYSLVEGPETVLAGISLATRLRTKILSLVKQCFRVETNAPILKVEETEIAKKAA